MNPHCKIGRVTPTEQGLRCPEFMRWMFERPYAWPDSWMMGRFMRID